MKFLVTLTSGEDDYIVAECPSLPGCFSQGRTREEALSNIQEAIRGYLVSLKKHGDPLPQGDVEQVEVAV